MSERESGAELNRSDFDFKFRAPDPRRWCQTVRPHVGLHLFVEGRASAQPGIAAVPQGRSRTPASTAKSKGPQGVPSPVAFRLPSLLLPCHWPRGEGLPGLFMQAVSGILGLPPNVQIHLVWRPERCRANPKAKQKVVTTGGPCAVSFAAGMWSEGICLKKRRSLASLSCMLCASHRP